MADEQHLLTRRQSFGLAGLTGAAFVAGCARGSGGDTSAAGGTSAAAAGETPSCVLVPEVTEGPYFLDERMNRSDIRASSAGGAARPGIPLRLKIRVVEVGGAGACTPYEGAAVDIWHTDAEGVYSGIDNPQNPGGAGTDFLRGYQVTNAEGAATFRTIFPGWYRGRAIHIHVKVRVFDGSQETFEYTSQLFFAETTIDQVYARAPYSSNGDPDTSNDSDGIYAEMGGTGLVRMSGSAAGGYSGTVTLGISDLPANGSEDESARARGRILGVRWSRDAGGRRVLRARLDLGEPMKNVTARIVRGDRVLAEQKSGRLGRGTRALRVPVGSGADPGPAVLRLVLRDRGSAVRTVRRRVRIPAAG